MRFPLRLCACALVLSAHAWAFASAHDTVPAAGPCGPPTLGPAAEDWPGETASAGGAETAAVVAPPAANVSPAAAVVAPPAAGEERVPEPPAAAAVNVSSFAPAHASLLEGAYADALDVLSGDEECGDFFGGHEAAGHVLGRLVGQLREESFKDAGVGIRMKGTYSTVHDMKTGARFRLFDDAAVNRNGPFFKAQNGRKAIADCGSFPANTRGARAAMLLHELGHLMRGPDGHWLLPNDGHNPGLVARNTARVEKSCGRGIKALGRPAAPADGGLAARARR